MKKINNLWSIAAQRVAIAEKYYGLDLHKNYFELLPLEMSSVGRFRKVCGFSGKNILGRSQDRQFWYYLQRQKSLETRIEEEFGLPF